LASPVAHRTITPIGRANLLTALAKSGDSVTGPSTHPGNAGYKDVRLCVDEAEALGVPMVLGAVVRQMLAVTNAKFGPDSDFTSIAKVVEEWAGVEIRS
jgi:3-hydroxyisobutyrate dehydrogenase-like beta-hydroxyacid dehydrogenase